MNTKEFLTMSIENLKKEENLEAQENVKKAKESDVDDSFEDLCLNYYNNLLIEDDIIAKKFKNIYTKQLGEKNEKENPNIIINNNNNNNTNMQYTDPNRKVCKKSTALILCALGFVGLAGIHKFYEGKIGMGILYLFTGGFFFIGTILDFIALLGKPNTYYAD